MGKLRPAAAVVAINALVLSLAVSAVAVVAPTAKAAEANPTIADKCGFDATLVLDASGSIASAKATEAVRGAGQAFLTAMSGTDSTARVVDFATFARESAPSTLVTADTLAPGGVHARALHSYYHPKPPATGGASTHRYARGSVSSESSYRTTRGDDTQYTNWDAALHLANSAPPELVVFVTDGDPSAVDSDKPGDPFYTGAGSPDVRINMMHGDPLALAQDRAIEEADALKRAGSRVLVIGVGSAFGNDDSVTRLKQISGDVVVDDASVGTVSTLNDFDVALVRDFSALQNVLRDVVTQLCSPSLTVRKLAQSSDSDSYEPAPGWDFTATPSVAGGTYQWIQPAGASVGPQTVATNANGNAQFQWEPDPSTANSSVRVVETAQSDFTSDRYRCEVRSSDGSVSVEEGALSDGAFELDLGPDSIVACEVWNSFDFQPAITLGKSNAPAVVRGDIDGATVTSTYTLENTGNTVLQMQDIVDDRCAPVVYDNADAALDPGEVWQATCTHEVRRGVTDQALTVTNTATVRGTDPRGTPVTATTTANVSVHTPAIGVEKTASTAVVADSGPVTYTYDVTNLGNVPLSVTIADDKCSGLTGPSGPGVANGELAPGDVWTYECTQIISEDTINTVTVTGQPPVGPPVTATDVVRVAVEHPGLDLSKSANRHIVFAGDEVTYTYAVTTGGGDEDILPGAPRDSWVQDDQCSPVTYVQGDNDDDILQPSETWEYTCSQVLTQDTLNRAEIQGEGVDTGETLTRFATDVVRVLEADVEVEKVALTPVVEDGGDAVFLYAVENTGMTGLTNVAQSIVDDKCSPVEELYVDPAGTGILEPGDVWLFGCATTVSKAAESTADTPTSITNTVTLTAVPAIPATPSEPAITGDPLEPSDTATIQVVRPGIEVGKTVSSDLVQTGSDVDWTVTVTNTGDVALDSIDIHDDQCAPMEYRSGDANDDQALDVDETWSFTCTDAVVASVTNTATVVGHPPVGPAVTGTDTARVDVYDAQIALTKDVDRPLVPVGDTVNWTLEATNAGTDPVSEVVFEDTLCDGVTGPAGDTNGDGNLDPSETWEYACVSVISDLHVNVAVIGGRDPGQSILLAAAASAAMPYEAGISVQKTADRTEASSGDTVTYTYEVSNTGEVPLANVASTIVDDRCFDVQYVSGDVDDNGLLTGVSDIFESGGEEIWVFTCEAVLTETTTNVVTVTGTPVSPDATVTPLGPTVTGTSTATVTVPELSPTVPSPTPSASAPTPNTPDATPSTPSTPDATPTTPGGLPLTGFDGWLLALGSLGLIVAGAGFIVWRRRHA